MRTARPGRPEIAVAYLRVSTEDQRLGPEAQRAAIEQWAKRENVTVVAWHTDQGVGGGSELEDRPGLLNALGDLRENRAGLLLVARRDRLAAKRARGYRAGEVSFGFVADEEGRLAPCEQELQVIGHVRRLREEGHSLRSIVRACSALGYTSRSGKPFALTQVARLARKAVAVSRSRAPHETKPRV